MKTTTKRRKAWVTFDQYGPGGAYRDRKGAAARVKWASKFADAELHEEAARMVEARPGDVVLSREGRRTLAAVVDWMRASNDTNIKVQVSPELDALLRGGQ